MPLRPPSERTVALLPWGDLIEDFLGPIGCTPEQFASEMTGGWLFGYVEALQAAGVRVVIVCVTGEREVPARLMHRRTQAPLWLLPAPGAYLCLRAMKLAAPASEPAPGGGRAARVWRRAEARLREAAPYLSTPVRLLGRVLRQEGCGAILCQEYEYPRFDVCVALGRLMRLPVFATFQGGNWQASRYERFVRPLTMQAAQGFIIGSEEEARRVRRRYGVPLRKIARLPNPLDLRLWPREERRAARAARAALGLPADVRLAVWHGRVDCRRKGLDVLLEAWRRVRAQRGGGAQLLLVGTGADAAALRAEMEAMHLEGVRWVDRYVLDKEVLRRYLAAGDVYVLPSRHEGFAVAPMEAMACGLPVVATDVPGIAELLGGTARRHGGLVVPREDPEALACALAGLLGDAERSRRLGRRARRRIEEVYSPEAVGSELASFLRAGGLA